MIRFKNLKYLNNRTIREQGSSTSVGALCNPIYLKKTVIRTQKWEKHSWAVLWMSTLWAAVKETAEKKRSEGSLGSSLLFLYKYHAKMIQTGKWQWCEGFWQVQRNLAEHIQHRIFNVETSSFGLDRDRNTHVCQRSIFLVVQLSVYERLYAIDGNRRARCGMWLFFDVTCLLSWLLCISWT